MKIGATIQLLSFEMGLACNLSHLHPRCPNTLGAERYAGLPQERKLSVEAIISTLLIFYNDYDFRGWVGFSFYNEPMLEKDSLLHLVATAKYFMPDLKFMLTTNGTRLPEDVSPFGIFDWIGVTNYGGEHAPDSKKLDALRSIIGVGRTINREPRGLFVSKGRLDHRMRDLGPERAERACVYPFQDFAIDVFGNCHLCCFDWRGRVHIGNVFIDGVSMCLMRWEEIVRSISGNYMSEEAPETCRRCWMTHFQRLALLDATARKNAKMWLREVHR